MVPWGKASRSTRRQGSSLMLVVFVLMWVPCSTMGYVVAMGCLPAMPVAFVASSLCTILPYSTCAISPTLCFTSPAPSGQSSGTSSVRSMAARNLRGVGGAGMVVKSVQPGHDRAPGGLWDLAGGLRGDADGRAESQEGWEDLSDTRTHLSILLVGRLRSRKGR